jgi:uncharacterized protein
MPPEHAVTFDSFTDAYSVFLWSSFAIALIFGAVANVTNFCTMGAISDVTNIGDWGRLRAWLLAIAVALTGVVLLERVGLVLPGDAFPPYRSSQLVWAENLLGGFMFGIGMTLASGCGNKCLVRIGGGNLKSVIVFAIIAVTAYFMIRPFPGSDQTLFSLLFYYWIRPLAINLGTDQDIGTLLAGSENAATARLSVGIALSAALLWFVFRSAEFRRSGSNIAGGTIIGLAVLAAWYVSSNVAISADGEHYTLSAFAAEWDFLSDSDAGKPADVASLSPQSYTFINPMGQSLRYVLSAGDNSYLTFGVMAVAGVVAGSFLWSVSSGRFRFEWFADSRDFARHIAGAALMGIGGVLGMGCTIGQGITGLSTLAVGSFIAFGAIIFGAALTMKVQYYKIVYEADASLAAAVVSALVDMHLLPKGMRRLDT